MGQSSATVTGPKENQTIMEIMRTVWRLVHQHQRKNSGMMMFVLSNKNLYANLQKGGVDAADLWSLLGNILQMGIISKLMTFTTTNLSTNTLMVNGVYSTGDFGRLKHVTGLKLVITRKAMVGVESMQNALNKAMVGVES